MKGSAKIRKIAGLAGWFLLCFLLLVFSFLNSSAFQNLILRDVISGVSKDLGVELSFSGFRFSLPNTVRLQEVYVPDQKGDTLFYLGEVKIGLKSYNGKKYRLGFSEVYIKDAFVNFGNHEGEPEANYEFFFTYLSPPRKDTIPREPIIWTIAFDRILLENTTFRYFNKGTEPLEDMAFNSDDIRFEKIYADLEDMRIVDDSLSFRIQSLRTVEHSGLTVEHFEAFAKIHGRGLEFAKMKLQTPGSSLGNALFFRYENWESMSDFIENVQIEADLANSFLAMKDLLPFGNALEPLAKSVFAFEGDLTGTISRLRFRNATIRSMKDTYIEGRFDLTGLPDIQNTYLNFTIGRLHSVPSELFSMLNLPLPDEVRRLGYIDYKGRLNGFFNNFVAFGDIQTGLGMLKTDINLDFREGFEDALYSGRLSSKGFNLGGVFANKQLGAIQLSVGLKNGKGMTPERFSFDIEGSIPKIHINGYSYQAIKLEGKFTESLFRGEAFINDPNLQLDFNGMVDITKDAEMADFITHVYAMNLKPLGLDTAESGIKGNFTLNTQGFDIDKITGILHTQGLEVYRGEERLQVLDFNMIAELQNDKRHISLASDFADVDLSGDFSLKNLPDVAQTLASRLLPGIIAPSARPPLSEQMEFFVRLRDADKVIALFEPDIKLNRGIVKGGFHSQNENLDIEASLDNFEISGIKLSGITLKAGKSADTDMVLRFSSGLEIEGSKFRADSVQLLAEVKDNFLSYRVRAKDKAEDLNLRAKGSLSFVSLDQTTLFFENISLGIKGKNWRLRDTTSVYLGSDFALRPIELFSETESVKAEYIGSGVNKKIAVNLRNFEIENVNGFMPASYPDFFGLGNGNIDLQPMENGMMGVVSRISIDHFALDKDTVGTIELKTQRITSFQNQVDCEIKSGIFNGVTLKGVIGSENLSDALSLVLTMPTSDVAIFGQFLPGISGLKGGAGAEININGSLEKPVVDGSVYLANVSLAIDYLQVPFTINSKVEIEENKIIIDKGSVLKDDKGRTANINGVVSHKNFSDWNYNVNIENMKDFHVLSTTKKDNDLFYGQAYADGSASFFGTFDKFNIAVKARSKAGTQIMMPIGDSEVSGPASYISFKTEKTDTLAKKQTDVGFLNTMLIDLEVTPDTEIQLIFDEQTGDIIKGAGTGRLTMEVKEDGEFIMRGGVVVERGDYQFVAFNSTVNKKFFIERGGTIMWDGDPLQARINLVTYNIQKASPNPLLGRRANDPSSQQGLVSTVEARSEIKVRGNLFSPEISFGFDIPNLMDVGMSELSSVVQRIKNDYDEVSRQVFSLLVFGSFMTPTFVSSETGGLALNPMSMVSNSIADLISGQVDAWLSQIDDKWLVDFSLTNVTPDQRADMIFRLGRKFANNRIIIDATVGTSQSGQANNSFNMEYLATKDGRFRLKAFSRNQAIYNNASVAPVNTFGLGFYYRKEFNSLRKWQLADSVNNPAPDTLQADSVQVKEKDTAKLSFSVSAFPAAGSCSLSPFAGIAVPRAVLWREEEMGRI